MPIKQYLIPTSLFSEIIEAEVPAGAKGVPPTSGYYVCIAGALAEDILDRSDVTPPEFTDFDYSANTASVICSEDATIYWLISGSGTPMTGSAIKNIALNGGADLYGFFEANTGITDEEINTDGLDTDADYFLHFAGEDPFRNISAGNAEQIIYGRWTLMTAGMIDMGESGSYYGFNGYYSPNYGSISRQPISGEFLSGVIWHNNGVNYTVEIAFAGNKLSMLSNLSILWNGTPYTIINWTYNPSHSMFGNCTTGTFVGPNPPITNGGTYLIQFRQTPS